MFGTFFEREENEMKRGSLFCVVLLMAFVFASGLSACHTVKGVGKDIEAGGKAIQKAAK
jgi:predicted small secreted protein